MQIRAERISANYYLTDVQTYGTKATWLRGDVASAFNIRRVQIKAERISAKYYLTDVQTYGTKATWLRGDVASALICTFRLLLEIDNFFGLALPQETECLKICYFFCG